MNSEGRLSQGEALGGLKQFAYTKWEGLTDRQKSFAKKAWGILTYKWR